MAVTAPLTSWSASQTLADDQPYGYIATPGAASSIALEWSADGAVWTRFANHPTSVEIGGAIPKAARYVRGGSFGTAAGSFQIYGDSGGGGLISGLQRGTSALARQLNAATLAAQLAQSGRYQLPPGDFSCDPFTIAASVVLEGCGASNAWSPVSASPTVAEGLASGEQAATILRFVTTTLDCITVTAPGVVLRNFHIQGAQAATAGSLVRFGATGAPADGWRMEDCSAKWGFIQVRNTNGAGYALRGNFLLGARGNAFYVENIANADYGDPEIHGNSFVALYSAPAAVYVKSGGGLRFTNNKINWGSTAFLDFGTYNWVRGIHIDNPNGSTSVLVVTGNSLENIGKQAIFVDCSTAGSFSNLIIGSNEFFSCGAVAGEYTIDVQGRAASLLHNLGIGPNTFQATRGIQCAYINSGAIAQQSWYAMGGTGPYLNLGTSTGGVDAMPQQSSDAQINQVYFQDADITNSWKSITQGRGNRIYSYTREIPDIVSNAAYTEIFRVEIPEYGACTFRIALMCSSAGNGQASLVAERLFANESAAPILGIINVDAAITRNAGVTAARVVGVSATNPVVGDIDVRFSTGGASGAYCNIGVKRSAGAAGTRLNGVATLTVDGAVGLVQKL